MKVLWFCNVKLSEDKITETGSWLEAMADVLVKSGEVELYNITTGIIKQIEREDCSGVKQWIIPYTRLNDKGLPSVKIIKGIQNIVDKIKPDIIHIWGTENYWGLLTARGLIKGNVLLEIQGLTSQIKKYTYSGLSFKDLMYCIGIKELLRPSVSLISMRNQYEKWSVHEMEIIKKHSNISTQSDWVRSYIIRANPDATIYRTIMPIRKEFLKYANKWSMTNCDKFSVYTSASSTLPFKGLSVLIDAIGLLKQSFPYIKLNIAGQFRKKGIRQEGYTKFIINKIKKLGLIDNVIWLGALNADKIVSKLIKSHVAVVPSFIESYSLALKESITVGVPVVASYAGAMPELGKGNKMVAYCPPGDSYMFALSIEKIFLDNYLDIEPLKKNTETILKSMDVSDVQIEIYRLVDQ